MGDTPLHRAAKTGDVATIEALLKRGANINVWDNSARTPLAAALMEGEPAQAAVALLRSKGARGGFPCSTSSFSAKTKTL